MGCHKANTNRSPRMDNIDLNALKGMWLHHKRNEETAKAKRDAEMAAILKG